MTTHSPKLWLHRTLVIVLAVIGQSLVVADSGTLQPGVELPVLEGQTLNGELATLPRDARGHAVLIVMGFTKAAAKITRVWLDNCRSAATSRSAGSGVHCYDIRMLEDVPRAFRGMVERSMSKGLSTQLQRQTILVYSENDTWRKRVRVADDKTAYVIGCDAQGRVRGNATGSFVEKELSRLLGVIEPMPPTQ